VRNPDRPPQAYWLPTPSDKFYPDFVALLKDGRTLVVEYKGSQLLGGPDTRQKEAVGKLWEARSGGTCVFRLVSADDYEAQLRAVAAR
jgi:type III restriction enzyme